MPEPIKDFESFQNNLYRAVETSYRGLLPFRELVKRLIEDYAGNYYGVTENQQERYLNPMQQAVKAYQMLLAANRPRVLVTTENRQLQPFATQFGAAINAMIKEIGLEYTLRQWVLDAFFCVGIIKTHMADSGLVEMEPDLWMDPGTPFASNVSLDNFVYDMSAKKWSEVKFAGDMYRIPFADLQSEMYDQSVVANLTPTSKLENTGERVEHISTGMDTDQDELEPMIDLCDIWVPRKGMIYTYPVQHRNTFNIKSAKPLAQIEWDGSEHGPYHLLALNDVPENIMPSSPAAQLESLDRLVNNLMRKNARRAERQKQLILYDSSINQDAAKMNRAKDGAWVKVSNAKDAANRVTLEGVDTNVHSFMAGAIDMFDRQAGNLSAMLGLGASTGSVGQEQLVHGAVSRMESEMQYRVLDATTRLVKELGAMLWNDKFKIIVTQIPIEGYPQFTVDAMWTPEERAGNFLDYNFEIDVFSMQYQSPASRVQAINTLLSQVYLPMAPLLQQQGGTIDMFALTKSLSDLMNIPQLKDIIVFQGVPDEPPMPLTTAGKPPGGARHYVRHNVSRRGDKPSYGAGPMTNSNSEK